ncbi:MAG: tetratricopeptide repeat-containing sensor histidine kinase [Psychroserpens sp.]|uniref:tetratricopeptide repeat-containing sensor histidine kinase n=1 Tax=Psychroserpens sp. TaxID=2020870 RepID=UPI003C78B943
MSQTNEIDSLTVQLAFQKQDSSKINTSIHLIRALYDSSSYKKALTYIDNTERLATSLNYDKGIADVNYFKACIYAQKNDYYNAIDGYKKSKRFYYQLGDTLGIAKVNHSVGLIEIKRGNYQIGLEHSLRAIQTFESRNLNKELSSAYNNLAEAYYKTFQTDKALDFNLKALQVRKKLKDSVGIKTSMKTIASLYSERKEHRKAIEYYDNVLNILNPVTDQNLKGEILPRIGAEYLRFKEYDKAANYLIEGLTFNRDIKNDDGILRALNAIGELNIQKRKTKLAKIQVDEAYAIATKIDNQTELLKNYRLQKEIDSINGRFQNAYFWQGKYFSLKNKLDKANQPEIPSIIEVIDDDNFVEVSKVNSEEIENRKEKNESASAAKLTLLYVLGALLLLLVILLILLYGKYKNTQNSNSVLKQRDHKITTINQDMLEQVQNLEEVNSVKDRLFSIVSHDLKDSISSIKGFIDLLKDDGISREEFHELIPELSENADSASQLLFNLLNWSKSQMQNLEPKAELFNIQDVFRNKMSLVEQKVEHKRIVLIDESHRDFIYADRSMIEIVIQNLITNAVKFTRIGDTITVSNSDLNGKSLICVEDTGVGISDENIEKLFKSGTFTTRGTSNEKGTGLGLTICKELVELNDGRIWVESTPGVGTKFYVELPKTKASKS